MVGWCVVLCAWQCDPGCVLGQGKGGGAGQPSPAREGRRRLPVPPRAGQSASQAGRTSSTHTRAAVHSDPRHVLTGPFPRPGIRPQDADLVAPSLPPSLPDWLVCVQSEKADVLAELGHTTAAMDVFAQRGDWDRVWEMAAKERVSAAVLCKYAAMRAKQLLDEFSGKPASQPVRGCTPHEHLTYRKKPRLPRGPADCNPPCRVAYVTLCLLACYVQAVTRRSTRRCACCSSTARPPCRRTWSSTGTSPGASSDGTRSKRPRPTRRQSCRTSGPSYTPCGPGRPARR